MLFFLSLLIFVVINKWGMKVEYVTVKILNVYSLKPLIFIRSYTMMRVPKHVETFRSCAQEKQGILNVASSYITWDQFFIE